MKIAIIGCTHGELDLAYKAIEETIANDNGTKIDLLLCCGDFECVRNEDDLETMACPPKYRHLNSFYRYYTGQVTAPILTVFIGGNHEASNFLQELPYGGWVAPNIYYLGNCGCVKVGSLRIAGLSGIYKPHDLWTGRFEKPPYSADTLRSVFHVKMCDVARLQMLSSGDVDVFMSHDWPVNVTTGLHASNLQDLLRKKQFFREDIQKGELGSPVAATLMNLLKPKLWFSAHLHVKYAAIIKHGNLTTSKDEQEIDLSEEEDLVELTTKFLALDKVLPRREFLQVISIDNAVGPFELAYDEEWLSIVKATHHLIPYNKHPTHSESLLQGANKLEAAEFVGTVMPKIKPWLIPLNFQQSINGPTFQKTGKMPNQKGSKQTDAFFDMLALSHFGWTVRC